MTNDYMFRVILQKNQFVLKGLIASLLHLEHQNIKNIYITNPIKLGEQIDSKAFVMDIHVILNDDTLLNLEMQLLNTGNWAERSLSYLCRMYDQLQSGDDYAEANTKKGFQCRHEQIMPAPKSLFMSLRLFLSHFSYAVPALFECL